MGNGIIKYLIESILSVVYDNGESCILCSSYCDEDSLICSDCSKKINIINKKFKIKKENIEIICYSSSYYNGAVMELIKRLKYRCDFRCGEVLSRLLIKTIEEAQISYDILSFVPLHRKTFSKRGFNQSKFLAKLISNYAEKPVVACLKKIKQTRDQIGLDDEMRWDNLKGSFKAVNRKLFKDKKILFIDDVLTTGATAFCCSKELLNQGAKEVIILTAAKSRV
jgi:competence protein ComFC